MTDMSTYFLSSNDTIRLRIVRILADLTDASIIQYDNGSTSDATARHRWWVCDISALKDFNPVKE